MGSRAQLFSDLASAVNRQDKIDLMPSWLSSAEFRLNNLLRDREMVTRAIMQVTDLVFATPPDFLEADTMSIQAGTVNGVPSDRKGALFYVPPSEVDNDTENTFVTDNPHWFTTRGKYIELVGWRALNIDFQVQLYYYAKLPKLVNDESTNWLLDQAPHLYENAMAHFAYQHLHEWDLADKMLQMVAAECASMNERTQSMKYGTGPLIKRPPAQRMGGRHS